MSGLVGIVVGFVAGGVVTGCLATLATRRRACEETPAPELSEEDREAVTAEFAVHASAVRRGVSEYADVLAGDDRELRERLRRFEVGDQ